MLDDSAWTTAAKPLLFLDLKLGNICNLKCRICGSWSSSTYATEQLQTVPKSQQKQNYHYIMLRAGAWPKESSVFWGEIEKHIGEIRYIEFTGGEPFMIREHFNMLKSLVDKGIANQVEIHYNTNGTQWPEDAEEIWKHFKTVEIAFSIDDLGERFEYQRSNAIWSEVTENLQRFREVRSRHQNIQLQVCSTVNIFNIWHLEKLAEWIDMQGFDFVYWNMLHEPQHFCIASLPLDAKKLACHRLETAMVREFHRQEFNRIRDFMMAGVSLPVEEITKSLRQLDQLRDQDLRDVICELAEVLEYQP
jgi:MoaA/NifB/PqqE/SkfB family radical SAM enzyme